MLRSSYPLVGPLPTARPAIQPASAAARSASCEPSHPTTTRRGGHLSPSSRTSRTGRNERCTTSSETRYEKSSSTMPSLRPPTTMSPAPTAPAVVKNSTRARPVGRVDSGDWAAQRFLDQLSLRTDHPGGDRLVDALCTADRGRRRPDVNNMQLRATYAAAPRASLLDEVPSLAKRIVVGATSLCVTFQVRLYSWWTARGWWAATLRG